MNIQLNRENIHIQQKTSIIELLEHQGMNRNVAVWVNGNRLMQRDYATYFIKEGDQIRVLRPLGGG